MSDTDTATESTGRTAYLPSSLVTPWLMSTLSSSESSSASPLTVKVTGVLQSAGCMMYAAGDTVAAPSSSLVAVTVTGAVGWLSRTPCRWRFRFPTR